MAPILCPRGARAHRGPHHDLLRRVGIVLLERESELGSIEAALDGRRVRSRLGAGRRGRGRDRQEQPAGRRDATRGEPACACCSARGAPLEQAYAFGTVRALFDPVRATRRLGGADRRRRRARPPRARPRAGGDRARRRRDPRHAARAVLARRQPVRGAAAGARGRRRALGRPAVAALARPPGAADRRAAAAGAARRAQRRAAERSAAARRPADRAVAAPAAARAGGAPRRSCARGCEATRGGLRRLPRRHRRQPVPRARARVRARRRRRPGDDRALRPGRGRARGGAEARPAAGRARARSRSRSRSSARARRRATWRRSPAARRDSAAAAADALRTAGLLAPGARLEFAHPILAAAVAAGLGPGQTALLHRRAWRLLHVDGADPERQALQLLQAEPEADADRGRRPARGGAGRERARRAGERDGLPAARARRAAGRGDAARRPARVRARARRATGTPTRRRCCARRSSSRPTRRRAPRPGLRAARALALAALYDELVEICRMTLADTARRAPGDRRAAWRPSSSGSGMTRAETRAESRVLIERARRDPPPRRPVARERGGPRHVREPPGARDARAAALRGRRRRARLDRRHGRARPDAGLERRPREPRSRTPTGMLAACRPLGWASAVANGQWVRAMAALPRRPRRRGRRRRARGVRVQAPRVAAALARLGGRRRWPTR